MPKPLAPHSSGVVSRRTALRAGAIGLLGLGANHVSALRAATGERRAAAKSVIYIFLSGGLAQHESFDPKPGAPSEIRGEFGTIPSRTPGLHLSEHLPRLARCSHQWALCRSVTHGSNDHSAGHHIMLTGRAELPPGFDPNKPKESDWPSIAALAHNLVAPRNNLPPAIVLPERLIHTSGRTIPGQSAGLLGRHSEPWLLDAAPFHPATYGAYPEYLFHHRDGPKSDPALAFRCPNLTIPDWLAGGRLQDRVSLTRELDRQQRVLEEAAGVQTFDRHWNLAVSLLTDGRMAAAFDVNRADPKRRELYGENSFGWSLLLAAQLIEAGVGLVQVNLGNDETWDTHEAAFPNLKNHLLPPMDRAVAALLEDLGRRGLLDDTLVVMGSEFGRTPRISTIAGATLPGRDHWGAVQSVFFAGGGVRGGAVIGASDNLGAYPASDPQTPENLAATVFHALGLPETMTWLDEQSRPHALYHGRPIPRLLG